MNVSSQFIYRLMQFSSKSLVIKIYGTLSHFLLSLPKHFGSTAWGQKQGVVAIQSDVLEPRWNKEGVSLGGLACTML